MYWYRFQVKWGLKNENRPNRDTAGDMSFKNLATKLRKPTESEHCWLEVSVVRKEK
jgi:hypothetical protein